MIYVGYLMRDLRRRAFSGWHLLWMALGVCAVTASLSLQAFGTDSVRDELIRRQRQTGLTLAWIDHGEVKGIEFAKQSVISVSDISRTAFEPKGIKPRDFGVYANQVCWSHDQTELFGIAGVPGIETLLVVDLPSQKITTVATNIAFGSFVTPQCWSQDDRKLVYQLNGDIRLFDVESGISSLLARGTEPSWSPNGEWISFLHRGTYYVIRPDGEGRKKLFHKSGAQSPLYWAPDSRIVAYVRQLSFPFETTVIDVEVYGLRVRRLADGSDNPLCPGMNMGLSNVQWVMSAELMNRSDSGAPR
jgi:hypothetical protein